MTGRKPNSVRVPAGNLRLLALEAMLRYTARGLLLPGDTLFRQILDRMPDAE